MQRLISSKHCWMRQSLPLLHRDPPKPFLPPLHLRHPEIIQKPEALSERRLLHQEGSVLRFDIFLGKIPFIAEFKALFAASCAV